MIKVLIAQENKASAAQLAGILRSTRYCQIACLYNSKGILEFIEDSADALDLVVIDQKMLDSESGIKLKNKLTKVYEIPLFVVIPDAAGNYPANIKTDPHIIPIKKPFDPENIVLKVAALFSNSNGSQHFAPPATNKTDTPSSPMLILLDDDFNIQHVSGGGKDLPGTDKKQLTGSSLPTVLTFEENVKEYKTVRDNLQENPDHDITVRGFLHTANNSPVKFVTASFSYIASQDKTHSFSCILQSDNQSTLATSSSNLLVKALEQNITSVLITDARTKKPGPEIIYCNDAFCAMTGYKKTEIIGKTPRIFQGPKTNRSTLNDLKKTIKNGKSFRAQTYNYRKDGSEYIVNWIISPVRNDKNEIIYYVSFQLDVTKQVETERKLKESKTRFDQIAQHINPFFYIRSCETGNFTYMSPSFEQITGQKADKLYEDSDTFITIVHPEDRQRFREFYEGELNSSKSEIQFRIVRPDGEVCHIKIRTKLVDGSDDKPCHIIGSGDDVTREVEETTEKSELGAIIKSSESELYVIDRDTFQFKLVSSGGLKNLGYTEKELLSMNAPDILDINKEEVLEKLYDAGFGESKSVSFETRHYQKDGSFYHVLAKINFAYFHNSPVYVVSVTDISNQKQIEHTLQKNKNRLERAQQIGRIGDWGYDPKTEAFKWSDQIYKLYELKNAAEDGSDLFRSVMSEYQYRDFRSQVEKALKNSSKLELDHTCKNNNGDKKYFHITGVPQKNGAGEITKIEGTVQDITERKNAELKVRKQVKFLETTTSYIPGVVYQFKRDGDGNYSLEYMSDGLSSFFPCSTEEVIEDFNNLWDNLHPDDIPGIAEKIEHSYENQTLFDVEFRYFNEQGETRWMQAQSTPSENIKDEIYNLENVNKKNNSEKEEEAKESKDTVEIITDKNTWLPKRIP